MKDYKRDARFGYTLASGRLFMPIAEFQHGLEELLERPIMTHQMADMDLWIEAATAFESQARASMEE